MNTDWLDNVEEKVKRNNQILFSRDSKCLQDLLELIQQQKHRTLVKWAFLSVENSLILLRAHCPNEKRPDNAVVLCKLWAAGDVKMPIAKKALLEAHSVAKEIQSPEDIALCHAVGQACATVHAETHAIGLPIYELTALVRKYCLEQCRKPIENRIAEYIACMKKCEKDIDFVEEKWADFLLDDSRPNKEKILTQKKLASKEDF